MHYLDIEEEIEGELFKASKTAQRRALMNEGVIILWKVESVV